MDPEKKDEKESEKIDPPGPQPEIETGFEKKLENIINATCQENASNTPDFILAQYMNGCLQAFNTAVQQRENWYGRDPRPTSESGDTPVEETSEYPEHEKLKKVEQKSQSIGEFVDWLLGSLGYSISEPCKEKHLEGRLVPINKSVEKIISEYFGIDLQKIEKEKKQMLDNIRAKK